MQMMVCRLFGVKSLPESMLACCQLVSWKQISVKFESEIYPFHPIKTVIENVVCQNGGHSVQGEMS